MSRIAARSRSVANRPSPVLALHCPPSQACNTLFVLTHLQEREALLAAQRREYEERRAAAAKNRAAAEEQLRGPAADVRPRKQWQDVEVSV